MFENEKVNLVKDLDQIIEAGNKSVSQGEDGIYMPGSNRSSAEAGMNFANANMFMHTPKKPIDYQQQNYQQQQMWSILQFLYQFLNKNKKKRNQNESSLYEDLGYDNPYAIRQPQKGKKPEEDEEMMLWDALTGRIRKFKVDYGDAKPQDQKHNLKSSREQNRDMATGYSIASANQRISQPSGGKDPRGFEIPTGWRTPVGAGKDELAYNQAYNELMKRTQDNQQDPTQAQGAWQGHPAVDAFLDQVERLKEIEAANKTDAQGGAQQQMPGGGGENPMAAMMGGAGGGENPMAAMQKMMGGKKEEDDEEKDGGGGDMMAMLQQMMGGGEGGAPEGEIPPMPTTTDDGEEEEKGGGNDMMAMLQQMMGGGGEEEEKGGGYEDMARATSPQVAPPSQMGDVMKKKKKKDPSKLLQALLTKLFS